MPEAIDQYLKTLYIIRHAKSSWANHNQSDFERPLNERGHKDAPMMAEKLFKNKIPIDVFVSSTALRAKQTCEHFCKIYGADVKKIQFSDMLYHAPSYVIYSVTENINDIYNNAAVFCHNPGITDFVNTLCDDFRIDNMPTCGIVAVQADINHWKDFESTEKKVLFMEYPKKN